MPKSKATRMRTTTPADTPTKRTVFASSFLLTTSSGFLMSIYFPLVFPSSPVLMSSSSSPILFSLSLVVMIPSLLPSVLPSLPTSVLLTELTLTLALILPETEATKRI